METKRNVEAMKGTRRRVVLAKRVKVTALCERCGELYAATPPSYPTNARLTERAVKMTEAVLAAQFTRNHGMSGDGHRVFIQTR